MFARVPFATAALLVVVLGCVALVSLATPARAQDDRVQIVVSPTDSISVKLADPVCASRAEKGQTLDFVVAESLELSGHVVIDAGAVVTAEVVEVESNGRGGKGGTLVVQLIDVVARDGAKLPLAKGPATLKRVGGNRGIFAKIFTLWLIKGKDPCFTTNDIFHVSVERAVSVRVPRS